MLKMKLGIASLSVRSFEVELSSMFFIKQKIGKKNSAKVVIHVQARSPIFFFIGVIDTIHLCTFL